MPKRSRVWRRRCRHFLSLCSETAASRSGTKNHAVSTGFSRADAGAPDTEGSAVLYGNNDPIAGQADSRVSVPYTEKRTVPGTCADVSRFVCVARWQSNVAWLCTEHMLSLTGYMNNLYPLRQTRIAWSRIRSDGIRSDTIDVQTELGSIGLHRP